MPKELTRTEAAEFLGVSPRTLDDWATKKKGPDYRRRGRKSYYTEDDLRVWSDHHQLRRMLSIQQPDASA